MKIFDEITMCLRNLWRRKMRTLLTTFGVVIGTCAIVVMVSLGVGMNEQQMKTMENMGNLRLIQVYQGWNYEFYQDMQKRGVMLGDDPKLDYAALQRIKAIPHVSAATPMDTMYNDEVIFQVNDRYRFQGQIIGIDMSAMAGLGYQLSSGRFPTPDEYKNSVIVGSQAAYRFIDTKRRRDNMVSPYPDELGRVKDPFVNWESDRVFANIGDKDAENEGGGGGRFYGGGGYIISSRSRSRASAPPPIPTKYGKYPFKVTGVLASDEDAMMSDFDTRNVIYMDISRVQELRKEYNKKNKNRNTEQSQYDQLYVMADSVDTVSEVDRTISSTREFGYNTYSLTQYRESMQKQTQTIQLVLGGLAAISLLVAALGITNTMVMSIYERTREIGIMKVLGCVIGNIRTVFLMEAGCIGLLGGILGVGISYAISLILNTVLGQASGDGGGGFLSQMYMTWNETGEAVRFSIIPPWLVAGALVFAIGIGLVSGFSPANRAVKISALEAIKHE